MLVLQSLVILLLVKLWVFSVVWSNPIRSLNQVVAKVHVDDAHPGCFVGLILAGMVLVSHQSCIFGLHVVVSEPLYVADPGGVDEADVLNDSNQLGIALRGFAIGRLRRFTSDSMC